MKKTILLSLLAMSMLSACGIKPGHVSAPVGTQNVYPRTYPAPDKD